MNISIDRINGRDNRTNGQQWLQTNGETSLERARKNNGKNNQSSLCNKFRIEKRKYQVHITVFVIDCSLSHVPCRKTFNRASSRLFWIVLFD